MINEATTTEQRHTHGLLEIAIQSLPQDGYVVETFADRIGIAPSVLMQIFRGDYVPDATCEYLVAMFKEHCPNAWRDAMEICY